MSDFDDVLERLIADPSFQIALATDPDAALAGYRLAAEERELLRAQLVMGIGGERLVEDRTTKSGMVGLLGPVAAALGVAATGPAGGTQTLGVAGATETLGVAGATETLGAAGPAGTLGAAGGTESFGQGPRASESFGSASDAGGDGAREGFGTAGASDSLGSAPEGVKGGGGTMGSAPLVEAANYRTWVDVDGDGSWDRNRAYERADGGVDIHVDINRDGVTDFVGHDYDRDGLVDEAEFDDDHDGTMDRRMHDDTGDGWMDRETPMPRQSQAFGQAPASG